MHNNYYFLRQLSSQLMEELVGYSVGEIYSQSKNELIFSFYNKSSEKFLKAHLSPQFCCLSFPDIQSRARRNSVDLFQQIVDSEITDVCQIENDRSFYFSLTKDFHLLFKMHGNRSNIVLLQNERVFEVFKSSLAQDHNIKIENLSKQFSLDIAAVEILEGDYKKLIPTLGKSFAAYFEKSGYAKLDLKAKYIFLIDLLKYLEKPDLFIHYDSDNIPSLNLFKIHENDIQYESPLEILNTFFFKYISTFELQKRKSKLRNSISAQIKKTDSYIKKTSQKLDNLKLTSSYQHFGDLIMANLHLIKPYASEIDLVDFYTQKTVKIPLKSNLSPQLNAEKYYRKAKKQKIETGALTENIEQKKASLEKLEQELSVMEQTSSLKQLQKQSTSKPTIVDLPYHKIEFMNYEIFIGKNAVKNELLTFKTAKKDDLFLHAKDSPGSHVIIKKKSNQNFPKPVVEKAASLAAYYSKNKSEALCRVLYTPRKHVRKAKGAPAGAVIVEKEKVVLVKPEKN